MVDTTGGFTSVGLQLEADTLLLPSLSQSEAIEIGEIAHQLGRDRGLAITIEVQLGNGRSFILHCQVRNQKMIIGLLAKLE